MGHDFEGDFISEENNNKNGMGAWKLSTISLDSGVSDLQNASFRAQSTQSLHSASSHQYSSSSSFAFTSQSSSSLERTESMKRRLVANQSSLDQAISISPTLAHSVFISGNVPQSPVAPIHSHTVLAVQQDSYQQASAVQHATVMQEVTHQSHNEDTAAISIQEATVTEEVTESHHASYIEETEDVLIQKATVTEEVTESQQSQETAAVYIQEETVVVPAIAPTPTPRVSRKTESSALSMHYETDFSKMTAPVHQVDLDAASDDVVVIRQFDFAPSPVKWIRLYTSQGDPPAEIALKVTQKVSATCILGKEEEEGSFEEGWEEVVVQHYEEEVRKRVEHKRSQLLERIEQSRKTEYYSYGSRRRYDMISLGSPYSTRDIESPYPMNSFQTV